MILEYIHWNARPEIFTLGSFSIRWYGVLFAMGFLIGYFIMQDFFRREKIPIKILDQLTTYMVIATIIGARLGHCLFYEPDYYLSHPIEIFKIWEGGLASHGGAIGILIALYIFSRRNNVSYWWILDRIAIVTALAGFFIRIGNLMNSEIFGNITTLPWGFYFERASNPALATDPRHPTQIYEALSYLLIFTILMIIYYKTHGKFRNGLTISLFMILVFSARFVIEFLKVPQVGFERSMMINMGQLLSIPFVLSGIAGLFLIYGRKSDS